MNLEIYTPKANPPPQGVGRAVGRVGTQELTEAMIAEELQYHPAAQMEDAWQAATTSLVVKLLLEQRATQLGIEATSEEERTAILLEQELQTPHPTEAQCVHYFEHNRQRFQTPVLLVVSHILLAAAPDDVLRREEQRQLAEQLLHQLQTQPDRFTALAQQYSACPSSGQGGSLGQLSKGQTVAEFEQAVWRFPLGLAPQAVETRFGFHVVRVDQRVEGEPLEYASVVPRICQYLHEQATRTALSQYLQLLAGQIGVEGIQFATADSLLVQ